MERPVFVVAILQQLGIWVNHFCNDSVAINCIFRGLHRGRQAAVGADLEQDRLKFKEFGKIPGNFGYLPCCCGQMGSEREIKRFWHCF